MAKMMLKDDRKKAEPLRFHLLKFNYIVFIPQERIKIRKKVNIRRVRSKTDGKKVGKELLPQLN